MIFFDVRWIKYICFLGPIARYALFFTLLLMHIILLKML